MKIDVFGIPDGIHQSAIEAVPDELQIDGKDHRFDGPVTVSCEIRKNGDISHVVCRVSARLVMNCARCLEEYPAETEAEFNLVVQKLKRGEEIPGVQGEGGDDEDDETFLYVDFDEHSVDVTDHVHDAVLLSLPSKPLCRDDCRGLCQYCGQNLNEGECGCGGGLDDPRWADLKAVLDEKDKRKKK